MRTLDELINKDEPALPQVHQWLAASSNPHEVLAPSSSRADVLVGLQVTTRSPMGAIAYETGCILIDDGWLRFLGSGHPRMTRDIVSWNAGRSDGYLLVADDMAGGFFAINGGALGDDVGKMYYWAPDTLRWEALGKGYSHFLCWALSDRLAMFYEDLRWDGWRKDARAVSGDQCFNFYPFLWTKAGSIGERSRRPIAIAEQYSFNVEMADVLDAGDNTES